ncbi:MAG: hypothetical protein RLZZ592_1600 [Pseudomonadota bacterium]|jgi:non-specific serine/threonine protein kinase
MPRARGPGCFRRGIDHQKNVDMNQEVSTASAPPAAAPAAAARTFGHYALMRPLGGSTLTIAWLARDNRTGVTVRLLAARHAVGSDALRARCVDDAKRASQLSHPRLLPVHDVGCVDRFPYVSCLCDPALLPARVEENFTPMALRSLVRNGCELLEALAYAHEGSISHGDLGLHTLAFDASDRISLWGLGLGSAIAGARAQGIPTAGGLGGGLFGREVAAACLLIQHWIQGTPPHGEVDLPTLLDRWPTSDLRLPQELPMPIADSLRLMLDRAVETNPQRRFIHARSFHRAISGWRATEYPEDGGFDEMLQAQLRRNGHLPATEGLKTRVTHIVGMDKGRLDEMVEVLRQDLALTLSMLRAANASEMAVAGEGAAVTSVKRAMALLGTDGLRRVAGGQKPWPGTAKPHHATLLAQAMDRAHLAGYLAIEVAPSGADAENASLAAIFQNFGLVLGLYHFPDEIAQIQRLVLSSQGTDKPVTQDLAAMSVLGLDLQTLAVAFIRLLGLAEPLRLLVRPLSEEVVVRTPDTVEGWSRLIGTFANGVLKITELPQPQQPAALAELLGRYHSTLGLDEGQVRGAMRRAREKLSRHMR